MCHHQPSPAIPLEGYARFKAHNFLAFEMSAPSPWNSIPLYARIAFVFCMMPSQIVGLSIRKTIVNEYDAIAFQTFLSDQMNSASRILRELSFVPVWTTS